MAKIYFTEGRLQSFERLMQYAVDYDAFGKHLVQKRGAKITEHGIVEKNNRLFICEYSAKQAIELDIDFY